MRPRILALLLVLSLSACLQTTPNPNPGTPPSPPPASPPGSPPSGSSGVNPIDTQNRAAVQAAFNTVYLGGANNPALSSNNWSGNVAGCNAGDTPAAFKEAVLRRLNFYRALAGLPNVTLAGSVTAQQQAAALMMAANGSLSHSPPSTWKCYSDAGKAGAGSSNLAGGNDGVNAVDAYMNDGGSNNSAAGHRRWILFPPRLEMATGDVPGWNALYVFGKSGARPSSPVFVAYPTPGFFPRPLVPTSRRWSFSLSGANFSNATITMTANGAPLSLTKLGLQNGYGDNTVVWEVAGALSTTGDTAVTVKLENVSVGGAIKSFEYTVTVFTP